MPTYVYTDSSGAQHEYTCASSERPESITLEDGTVAHYDFGAQVQTIHFPAPALEFQYDRWSMAVHPSQANEYNSVARAIGISGADAQWDERGHLHATRTGMKKLDAARKQAQKRGADDDFKPSKNLKELKV